MNVYAQWTERKKLSQYQSFYDKLTSSVISLIPYETKLKTLVQEYIIKGDYPENVSVDDLIQCADNLKQYFSR